ncbi:MAG TPA: GNAT family N-acetyltransferase [Candidatus Melainabacteria bacterium]|nr:GNAT family N-acetyltransferase [Candidatus Melainabacteria bacterium]HIN63103.1 GNAT family N-acetyltransferase [Candidatus Obscuribacterales bacterium]
MQLIGLKLKYFAKDQLRDGRVLDIRSIIPEDKPILAEGMHHLSPASLYYRFLTPKRELTDKELAYFTEVDFFHHVALLASIEEDGKILPAGVARYVMPSTNATEAEIAFAVNEEYQGLGIATVLLRHLRKIAVKNGLKTFTALVLPDNTKMLDVFKHSDIPMKSVVTTTGVMNITLDLSNGYLQSD